MSRIWLPFLHRSLPVVSIRIGTDRYRALVDTGADVSMIAPDVSLRLGLQKVGQIPIVALSGRQEIFPLVELEGVGFAELELPSFRAAVRPIWQLGLQTELLLGVNAFAKRRLRFDFGESRVYIIE